MVGEAPVPRRCRTKNFQQQHESYERRAEEGPLDGIRNTHTDIITAKPDQKSENSQGSTLGIQKGRTFNRISGPVFR